MPNTIKKEMCENQKGTFHDLAYQRGNKTPILFTDRDKA